MPYQVLKSEPDACARRTIRLLSATALTAALLTRMAGSTDASTITGPPISVNGSRVAIAALERNNSVFVPVRGVFEKLGATVTSRGPSFVATRGGKELARMTVGNRSATVNGASRALAVAPFLSDGTVMLPLRVISEAAGASVAYAAAPRGVSVTRSNRAGIAGTTAAGVAGVTVARAAGPAPGSPATGVASAAPVADSQTSESGIPWWLWALLALLVLGLIFWALTRRKSESIITTRSSARGSEPTISTTGTGRSSEPTINTRK